VARRPVITPPRPGLLEVACDLEDATVDGIWLDRELGRLAGLLAAKLAVLGQSSAVLTLTIELARHPGPRWADEATHLELRSRKLHLKQAVAGAPAILARARDLLLQLAPDRPVVSLRLEAAGLGVAATQGTLLIADPKLAGHERLETVAHRLRGRFGPRAARRVQLVADAPLPEDRIAWDGPANLVPSRTRRIEVRTTATGLPAALRRDPRAWEPLRAICSQWRIRTNWWSIPTHRYYYLVETTRGAVLEIYQEQRDGSWYLAGRRD
jgi:hypothetical protein